MNLEEIISEVQQYINDNPSIIQKSRMDIMIYLEARYPGMSLSDAVNIVEDLFFEKGIIGI